MTFKLTDKQEEAQLLAISGATHILFEGGSRSGKTALHTRNVDARAIKAPTSRHLICRNTFSDVKRSIVLDTFPKIMRLAFPGVKYHINRTDWYAMFDNGAEIWFCGLDDKERVEKILGNEYVTIYFNECSQMKNATRETVLTRLAQKVEQVTYKMVNGKKVEVRKLLTPKAYYDCNPPSKGHWVYKIFHLYQDPETKKSIENKQDYVKLLMNPHDNLENLSPTYIKTLEALSPRRKKRFLKGEYSDENPNQLFSDVKIEENRVINGELPDFVRVVVAVDPSGSGDEENAHNDAIGIIVAAMGVDGNAYVLEDCTVKAAPETWGRVATDAYDRHLADIIVGEKNFGGDMVRFVIQTSKPRVPYKHVTASRGKAVRAEPISSLYDLGKVRHVGIFDKLEDELMGFSTVGYIGEDSPNRGDALVWAITELFPALVKEKKENKRQFQRIPSSAFG